MFQALKVYCCVIGCCNITHIIRTLHVLTAKGAAGRWKDSWKGALKPSALDQTNPRRQEHNTLSAATQTDFIKLVGRNSNWQKSVTGRDYMHTAQAHYPWMVWMVFLLIKADSPLFSLWLYTLRSLMCVTFDPVWLEVQDINTRTLDHGWSESNQDPPQGQWGWGTLLLLLSA